MGSFSQSVINVGGGGMKILLEKEYTIPSTITTNETTIETVTLPEFDLEKNDLIVKTETLKERSGTTLHWLGSQLQFFYCGDIASATTSGVGRTLYQSTGSTNKSSASTAHGLYVTNFNRSTRALLVTARASNTYAPTTDIAGAKAKLIVYIVPKPQ